MKQKKLVSTDPVLRDYQGDLSKRWYVEYYNEKGQRRKLYAYINTYKTLEERYEASKNVITQQKLGVIQKPKNNSVIYELLSPIHKKHIMPLRESSARDYLTILTKFDKWLLGSGRKTMSVAKFRGDSVQEFVRVLEFDWKISNATFNKYINVLDMLFNYLVDSETIEKNPFQFVKRKVKQSKSVSAFKAEDIS